MAYVMLSNPALRHLLKITWSVKISELQCNQLSSVRIAEKSSQTGENSLVRHRRVLCVSSIQSMFNKYLATSSGETKNCGMETGSV